MSRFDTPLPFGRVNDSEIQVMEFCADPDGSNLLWFRSTNDTIALDGLTHFAETRRETSGWCYDVGDYYSPLAELLKQALEKAPEGATLASFTREGSVGTRTFTEAVITSFYKPEDGAPS